MKKYIITVAVLIFSLNAGFALDPSMSTTTLPSGQKVVI